MPTMTKKTVMTLFSDPLEIYSHQVRIVLAEKGVNVDVINQRESDRNEELLKINPYHSVPTLIDRDLVLYDSRIIMDYLDERFPHPPLLPVYPVLRAQCRKMMLRIDRDWYGLYQQIVQNDKDKKASEAAKQQLGQSLLHLAPVFGDKTYFFSDEFTLVDCYIAPLLWRLPHLGIELKDKATAAIQSYAERVFARDTFQISLSDHERELRNVA